MSKAKITVTLEESLIEALDNFSSTLKKSRSRIVEEAVEAWRRHQMEKKLIEGYKAMAKEDAKMAEENLAAGLETIK